MVIAYRDQGIDKLRRFRAPLAEVQAIGSHVADALTRPRVAIVDSNFSNNWLETKSLPDGRVPEADVRTGCASIASSFRPGALCHLAAQE